MEVVRQLLDTSLHSKSNKIAGQALHELTGLFFDDQKAVDYFRKMAKKVGFESVDGFLNKVGQNGMIVLSSPEQMFVQWKEEGFGDKYTLKAGVKPLLGGQIIKATFSDGAKNCLNFRIEGSLSSLGVDDAKVIIDLKKNAIHSGLGLPSYLMGYVSATREHLLGLGATLKEMNAEAVIDKLSFEAPLGDWHSITGSDFEGLKTGVAPPTPKKQEDINYSSWGAF